MIKDRFYVYMYWGGDGVARYVGMGGTPNRWKSHLKKSDNIWLRRLVSDLKKIGQEPRYRKVAENLTKEQACAEEIRLIALYGREGIDKGGKLFNRTLGGDINAGYARPQTDAERLKRAQSVQKYWDSPEGYARKAAQAEISRVQMSTPEAKARTAAMGSARKGKKGKPATPEWRLMISGAVAESNRRRGGNDCKPETREKRRKNALARGFGRKQQA